MLRIALNGRFTGVRQPTGTQTAAFHLFDQITLLNSAAPECELVVFADPRFAGVAAWKERAGVKLVEIPFQDWGRYKGQLWEQWRLPQLCREHGCMVAHHPITTSPVWKRGVKSIVTLHDLHYYLHPEWSSRSFRLAYALCATPGLRRAERVVTISNYVCRQAREVFGFPPGRLRMIYNGVKPMVAERKGLGGSAPYLFCVGALQPHKNLIRVIEAFLQLKREHPELELYVAGRPQHFAAKESRLPQLLAADGVKVLGYLSEADLANAYAGAVAYCYPSYEEGFGLPVLEAMSVGTPVITSNCSCLSEVAGPSAILVDPYSVESIADGMRQALALTPAERERKAAEGKAWAARFLWERAAREYLKLYREFV